MDSSRNSPTSPESNRKPSKFPFLKVATVAITLFINYVSMQLVYPFIPFMIKDFFPELEDTELGYKVGTLGASFNLGQFCGSIIWGYIADIFGRRFALLSGIVGTFTTTLIFGFSMNYTWATISRFLWGILNGNVGVAKTYLSEILENEHQSKGFTILGTMDAVGRIVGPVIGGFLGNKNNIKFFINHFEIVRKFPYLVACSVCSIFAIIGFIIAYTSITETLTPEIKARMKMKKRKGEKRNDYSYFSLFLNRDIMISCCLYAIMGIHGSSMDEVLPLYLLNPKENGGFAYDSSKIGLIYLFSSPIQLLGLLFFYPKWINWFGYRIGMVYNAIIVCVITYFFPLLSSFNQLETTYVTAIISIPYGFLQLFRVMCFTSVIVLLNNSCLPEQKSKANAIGQTLSGACRSIGPYFGGNIFAWSENNIYGYPFDYTFLFRIISYLYIITSIGVYILPNSVEFKKVVKCSDSI